MGFTFTVQRGPPLDVGTFGTGTLSDGVRDDLVFDTLELPWRYNQPMVSCIPLGTYGAKVVNSVRFGFEVYLLYNVPSRVSVEIHPANFAGDVSKGWHSDLLGCMTVGHGVGEIQTPDVPPKLQRAVLGSRAAFDSLMQFTGGAPLTVRIVGFGHVGA